jgi:hypothetical protein
MENNGHEKNYCERILSKQSLLKRKCAASLPQQVFIAHLFLPSAVFQSTAKKRKTFPYSNENCCSPNSGINNTQLCIFYTFYAAKIMLFMLSYVK